MSVNVWNGFNRLLDFISFLGHKIYFPKLRLFYLLYTSFQDLYETDISQSMFEI